MPPLDRASLNPLVLLNQRAVQLLRQPACRGRSGKRVTFSIQERKQNSHSRFPPGRFRPQWGAGLRVSWPNENWGAPRAPQFSSSDRLVLGGRVTPAPCAASTRRDRPGRFPPGAGCPARAPPGDCWRSRASYSQLDRPGRDRTRPRAGYRSRRTARWLTGPTPGRSPTPGPGTRRPRSDPRNRTGIPRRTRRRTPSCPMLRRKY